MRDARRANRLSQRQLAERVGLSQPEIHRLESGAGATADLTTWAVVGAALGLQLATFFEQAPGADVPRDMEHLVRQNLVITTAARGGWTGEPEAPLADDGRYPRSIDVLLRRPARLEAAVVEVWDLLTDGGAAMRGLDAKVGATRQRLGPGWRVQGLFVVRGTLRNRQLIAQLRGVFGARFPGSSTAWLRALEDPTCPDARRGRPRLDRCQGHRLIAARLRAVTTAPVPLRMQHSGSCSPRPSTPSGSDPA